MNAKVNVDLCGSNGKPTYIYSQLEKSVISPIQITAMLRKKLGKQNHSSQSQESVAPGP